MPPPSQAGGRNWPLWPGLVAGGVGLASLGAGIALLILDGEPVKSSCRGEPLPGLENCAEIYDYTIGGAVATGVGAAALAASGVLLYLHFTSDKDGDQAAAWRHVMVSPTADGGLMVGAGGRF